MARRDGEFLGERLRRVSGALSDLFWLRKLEDPRAAAAAPPVWPEISYPPGLSGVDLLMSDLEALKSYVNYLRHASQIWFMPLPESYDPQKVADYFSCRPHILAFRFSEVFASFASAAIKLQVSRAFKFNWHGVDNDSSSGSSQYYMGQLLKQSMLNLGPTFVKVGQSLSTRPDIIGPEISKALSELHERIPPFPTATAIKIIEEELGCPVENTFSYFSEEPVAAASFGQVYKGCTLDGCIVAVKVQRPNLLHDVMRDIYILRLGLDVLRRVAKRKSDLCLYADELGKGLVDELDYRLEAANASDFLEAYAEYSFMFVPKVFRHLTGKRVLTMEWVIGENPNDLLFLSQKSHQENVPGSHKLISEAKARLLDLVNKGVEATLVQLLETGLMHADPHPGNLRYTSDGKIGFLDFGLLCRMEKKHQLAMLASIVHIVNGDWGVLVYDLTLMDVVRPGVNLRFVTMDLEESLGNVVFNDGIPDIKFSRVLGKIWSVALKYHFRMPPYYTLVLRSLASLEGLAVAADKDFKTFQAAYPFVVRKLLLDNSTATRRILHSVVFNKRREIQWQKILMFLRIGSTRKRTIGLNMMSTKKSPVDYNLTEEVFEVANLILRLLPSKDGTVMRRLLMTADGASLARDMVSHEATVVRRLLSRVLADVIYQGIMKAVKGSVKVQQESKTGNPRVLSISALQAVLIDRRLKVILYKIINDTRSNPVLMLRVCWSSFTVFFTASAVALHRVLIYWSETSFKSISVLPRRFAVSL